MKNKLTLKGMARSSFLTFILMLMVTMSGFSQMYVMGDLASGGWGTGEQMTHRDVPFGTSSYMLTYQEQSGGNKEWKFASKNDWTGSVWGTNGGASSFNAIQTWDLNGANNLTATLIAGKYYTAVFKDVTGDVSSEGFLFETSAAPVTFEYVEQDPLADVKPTNNVTVNITTSATPSPEEKIYVYYVVNQDWGNPTFVEATFNGANGTANIPAQNVGDEVIYYVLSTCVSDISIVDKDLATLNNDNAGGANYSYTVVAAAAEDAPVATYNPANNATNVATTINPTLTFDKDVFNPTDGSAFTDGADVSNMLTFQEVDQWGNPTDFAFTASITGRVITLIPASELNEGKQYRVSLLNGSVQNEYNVGNDPSSALFTTFTPTYDVTINVNMANEYYINQWDSTGAHIDLVGINNDWDNGISMSDPDGDLIYTTVLANQNINTELTFKFRKDGWNDADSIARDYTVIDGENSFTASYNNGYLPEEADFLTYSLPGQTEAATIDATKDSIFINMLYGTDITELTPTFTLSPGAMVSPTVVEPTDFTNDVLYHVYSYEGTVEKEWWVNVTVSDALLSDADITAFSFVEQTGAATIDSENATVAIEVAYNADLTNLTPTIEISAGASIDPASLEAQDFSSAFEYTVEAQDGTQKIWVVNVSLEETYNVSLSVNMNKQFNLGNFNPATDTVSIAGNFNAWGNDTIHDAGGDLIYTYATSLPAGYEFEYKFRRHDGENINWESVDNRFYTVIAGENADTVWFNNTPYSTDATLNKITVNGGEIAGFNPLQYEYNFPMPEGSAIPEVLGTLNDEFADTTTTQATAHPGSATILVTAEDGTQLTYTVNLIVGPSNVATLSNLTVDGATVDEFAANKFEYWVTLPYGTTEVPEVLGTVTNENADTTTTQAESVTGVATVYVLAEDGVSDETYTVHFNVALNDDATLSDLQVAGVTIEGFSSDTLIYIVRLPDGSAPLDITGATPTDPNANVTLIEQAFMVPGTAKVYVNAEDGTQLIYEVRFTFDNLSSDATLSDLQVEGVSIEGFRADSLDYTIIQPYGTTTIPQVFGVANDANALYVEHIQAESVTGAATVKVLAQDAVSELTYTVHFEIAPNNDATLSDLTVGGVTIPGFAADVFQYDSVLVYGTTVAPEVLGTTTDVNADTVTTQATDLPGAATVKVTAEDGTTELTYTVNFTIEPNDDATLSDLTLGGVTIPGFAADVFQYDSVLVYGTTAAPEVLGTTTDVNADTVTTQATDLPGAATVKVTAEDGITELTYTVNFTIAPNTDATLSDLTVDGVTIEGFKADSMEYTVELAYGTTTAPTVLGTVTDTNADTVTTQAATLADTALVVVTAEDGITELTYKVNFTIAPNNDATLSDLTVDGVTIEGFKADSMEYTVELAYGTTTVPTVLGTVTDTNADTVTTQAATLADTALVVVTAEDGITELTYKVNFTIAPNNDATLSDLTVDGVTIEGFKADSMEYTVELAYGTTTVPTVLGTVTDTNADTVTTQAATLADTALVVVTAEDGITELTYKVSFTIAPDSNAKLASITIDGEAIADFDADKFLYEIELPEGTTDIPVVISAAMSETATIEQVPATTLPGSTFIKVTAEDGVTQLEYEVEFTLAISVKETSSLISKVYPNPTHGNITIELAELNENAQIRVSDISGRTIMVKKVSQMETTIDLSNNKQGIYIITVISNNKLYQQKVVLK